MRHEPSIPKGVFFLWQGVERPCDGKNLRVLVCCLLGKRSKTTQSFFPSVASDGCDCTCCCRKPVKIDFLTPPPQPHSSSTAAESFPAQEEKGSHKVPKVPEDVSHAPKAQRLIRRWNSDNVTNIIFFSFPSPWVTTSNLEIKVTACCHRRRN